MVAVSACKAPHAHPNLGILQVFGSNQPVPSRCGAGIALVYAVDALHHIFVTQRALRCCSQQLLQLMQCGGTNDG